jgi:predicted nucleotidyltransferase
MSRPRGADRTELLAALRWFLDRVRTLPGIESVALIGSLATEEPNPKDLDVLVMVEPGADLAALAQLGRQAAGRRQHGVWGVDLFLGENGRHIGRACKFREPHPRVSCGRFRCVPGRPFLCDTSEVFTLDAGLISAPPLTLYPAPKAAAALPADVRAAFPEA